MSNPFPKKNPFMSLWLSGANAIVGSARGCAAAHGKREVTTAMTRATQYVFDFWVSSLMPAPKKRGTRRKR